MLASIVIRTYNEEEHLPDVLEGIESQAPGDLDWEVVLVDSGSTDGTLEIAKLRGCRIERIAKKDFSFGRSLNIGCRAAAGEVLVFLSGHCIPADERWLVNLVRPVLAGRVSYSYGRQIGGQGTKYSERRLFEKYFPAHSEIPQEGFFCNNANAALDAEVWERSHFDEGLTGLEDMELAKRITREGGDIGYVAEAPVYHLHDETWTQVRWRYEREAIALREIMPEVHVSFVDFLRYLGAGVLHDWGDALEDGVFGTMALEIVKFRTMQYWGVYRGNRDHRRMSRERKEKYFYPR